MALRFQSRLALAMSLLIAVTILVMAFLVIWIAIWDVHDEFRRTGVQVTRLATENIQYGISVPDRVMERVGDQMVVTSLLLAEFVAVAENEAGLDRERVGEILERVRERSRDVRGHPLVNDFWVTDENGRIYIGLEDIDFAFSPDPAANPQASEFYSLLEPGAKPVVQNLQPRDKDGKKFMYVGVGGVDKPRVVQIGAGEQLVESIRAEFTVQNVVDKFYSVLNEKMDRMVVVDAEGAIIAQAGGGAADEQDYRTREILAFCKDFLEASTAPYALDRGVTHVGVAAKLYPSPTGQPRALYMESSLDNIEVVVAEVIRVVSVLSIVMIAVAIGVSIMLSRSLSRPIEVLVDGAREFGEGNLHHRVELQTHDEFQRLGHAFNTMADSIHTYMHELEEETKRRERLESELAIAAELQQSLLPDSSPLLPGFQVLGWSQPAREVGGDFFDFVQMDDDRIGIAVGDATGKGLSAALLVSDCWSAFKALAEEVQSPAELLYRTNNLLCKRVRETGRFVTLFFMVADVRRGRLVYSVAGHNPPVMVGAHSSRRLLLSSRAGLPLGIERDCPFEEIEVLLEPRDTVVLYSDGLTEARSRDNALYGSHRFEELVAQYRDAPLPEVVAEIRQDVYRHMEGCDLADDMTLVAARYHP